MNARHTPTQWLSFFGPPALIDLHHQTPIVLKYRNGILLLAFLAAHPGRIFRRDTLADMLWPNLDSGNGRRNLRVVLSDLLAALKPLGLSEALSSTRDWLCFRPPTSLWTDESLLLALKAHRHDAAHWLSSARELLNAQTNWLDFCDVLAADDFQEWLAIQRAHLEKLFADISRLPSNLQSQEHEYPIELATLALLRVEIEARSTFDDEREAWRANQKMEKLLGQEVQQLGGILVEASLDGFTFIFGHGSVHSGFRWLALRAAINVHLILSKDYHIRAGVLSGRMLVEHGVTPKVSGQRVKLAEQLAALAAEGEILLDDSYSDLIHVIGATERGRFPWRNGDQSIHAFGQTLAELPNFLLLPSYDASSHFVGREETLTECWHYWQKAITEETQRICLRGQPGIGKTRCAHEFAQQLQSSGIPVFWLGARSETAKHPWSSLHELLSRLLNGCTGQDWLDRIQCFSKRFQRTLSQEQCLLLEHFLDYRGIAYNQRTDFCDMLHALLCPRNAPTLIVVDDAQWIDPATESILRVLARKPTKCLFLLTLRSNHSSSLTDEFITHDLQPLSDSIALAILKSLPESELFAPHSCQQIVTAAHGLPIYLLASCPQKGASFAEHLQAMINGVATTIGPLKVAALFGIQFREEDLADIVGIEATHSAIEQAIASNLLVSRGPRTWAFFHPLLHTHLYSLLDPHERTKLSMKAAALLANRGEIIRAAAIYEEGEHLDIALHHYIDAANMALDQEDIIAACQLFDQVARLGYGNDQGGLWARMRHARALVIRDGYGSLSVRHICQQVRACLPKLIPGDELSFTATAYAYLCNASEHANAGLELSEEMAPLAHSPIQKQTAIWAQANSLFWLGRFRQSSPLMEQALDAAERISFEERIRYFPSDPLVLGNAQYAWMLWFMGDPLAAEVRMQRAHYHAHRSRLRQDMAIVYCFQAALCWFNDDLAGLSMNANEAWHISDSEEFVFWKTIASLFLTLAEAHGGKSPNLLELLAAEKGMKEAYPGGLNSGRWLAASALIAAGHPFIALRVINRAISEANHQEHQYCLMDLWRLKAVALKSLPLHRKATVGQAHLQAVQLAQAAGAGGWLNRWYPMSGQFELNSACTTYTTQGKAPFETSESSTCHPLPFVS